VGSLPKSEGRNPRGDFKTPELPQKGTKKHKRKNPWSWGFLCHFVAILQLAPETGKTGLGNCKTKNLATMRKNTRTERLFGFYLPIACVEAFFNWLSSFISWLAAFL
jgi:hypothetical protein